MSDADVAVLTLAVGAAVAGAFLGAVMGRLSVAFRRRRDRKARERIRAKVRP